MAFPWSSSGGDASQDIRQEKPLCRVTRTVPKITEHHRRYFENPFLSETEHLLSCNNAEYLEDALALARSIYHHYSTSDYEHFDPDIYVGSAGVVYCFDKLIRLDGMPETEKHMLLGMAMRLINSALAKKMKESGFLIGYPGVLAVAALIYATAGDMEKSQACLQSYADYSQQFLHLEMRDSSGDELFAGRSGYLAGYLELRKRFPGSQILSAVNIKAIIEVIIRSGERYSQTVGLSEESPLMFFHYGSKYLGAAHGSSFILQTLLCFPEIVADIHGANEKIKRSVDYILKLEKHGNYPPQFDAGDFELVHFCHGAPGVIYLLAKAYLTWKDDKYLNACRRSADLIWEKGLLRKGPGICHGIAGNGFAFLLMYRLTKSDEWLYRAQRFADIMFQQEVQEHSRRPDNPFSLYEGVAGSACFLADITQPTKASFPFCDVFEPSH